jgi:hypothetical protein
MLVFCTVIVMCNVVTLFSFLLLMCCICCSKYMIWFNDLVEEVTCNLEVSSPLWSDLGHVPVC